MISFIVPAYNEERLLGATLDAVRAAARSAGEPCELIVVDDASTDRTAIVAEDHGRFRAQEVRIGDEANGKTQILDGLADGDSVVLSGQFLIDSEASLGGTLARLQGGDAAHEAHAKPAEAKP
jgi:Cu(I)/Ag(I) efflux system membrane fusion protein